MDAEKNLRGTRDEREDGREQASPGHPGEEETTQALQEEGKGQRIAGRVVRTAVFQEPDAEQTGTGILQAVLRRQRKQVHGELPMPITSTLSLFPSTTFLESFKVFRRLKVVLSFTRVSLHSAIPPLNRFFVSSHVLRVFRSTQRIEGLWIL